MYFPNFSKMVSLYVLGQAGIQIDNWEGHIYHLYIWSECATPSSPGNMGWNIVKRCAGSLNDDVRLDIVINFMFTWPKLSILIGQFKVEV